VNSQYLAVWEFRVKADSASTFERIYGPNGAWAQLFRRSPGYVATELIRDLEHPGRYLTLDRWTSREALQRFKQDNHSDYAALDKQCESLTEQENLIGAFDAVEG